MKDPAKAGLSPEERHLLGAVDGSLSVDELAFIAGRSSLEVDTMLDRLEAKGLVSFGSAAPPPAPVGTAASTDDIQLSAEARARIDHYDELARLADHYRLLDLPRDATTDEIKKAYYRLAPKFHPDKYYGKRLGPFKTKIEKIFASLTRAHDTLRYEKRRTAYDATLPPLRPGDRIRRR